MHEPGMKNKKKTSKKVTEGEELDCLFLTWMINFMNQVDVDFS